MCYDVHLVTCAPPYKVNFNIDVLGYFKIWKSDFELLSDLYIVFESSQKCTWDKLCNQMCLKVENRWMKYSDNNVHNLYKSINLQYASRQWNRTCSRTLSSTKYIKVIILSRKFERSGFCRHLLSYYEKLPRSRIVPIVVCKDFIPQEEVANTLKPISTLKLITSGSLGWKETVVDCGFIKGFKISTGKKFDESTQVYRPCG